MKTPEDEAFDELAKRQGAWGGGFPAKRQAAMDKLQDETDMLTIAYLDGYERGKKAALAYIAPPKREWVGLTKEEVRQCGFAVPFDGAQDWALRFYKAIEAKLKEKNNGT